MKPIWKPFVMASALCVAGLVATQAEAARVVVGVGVGIGVPYYGPGYLGPYGYYGAPYGYYPPPRVMVQPTAPAPAAMAPDPIYYPKNGQSAAQVEADRQECNRWATTQASAMADASTFQRATYACMEGRGYSVK
jgi:hypothetical protein